MTLAFALAAAVVFGTGAYLLLKPDLVRFVIGMVLISQSAVITIIASGEIAGRAPIHPLPETSVSDPLTQAMALTAIVIGLAFTALLLVLAARVYQTYGTTEVDEVAESEREADEAAEHERPAQDAGSR